MSNSRPPALGPERTRQQLQELDALLQQMLALPLADGPAGEHEETAPVAAEPRAEAKDVAPEPAKPLPSSFTEPRVKRLTGLSIARPCSEPVEPRVIAAKFPAPLTPELLRSGPRSAQKVLSLSTPPTRAEGDATRDVVIPAGPAPVPEQGEVRTPSIMRTDLASEDVLEPLRFDLTGPADMDLAHDMGQSEAVLLPPRITPAELMNEVPSRLSVAYQSLLGVNRVLEAPLQALGPVGRPFLSEHGRNFLGWLGLILLTGSAALALGVWLGWTW